MKAEKIVISFIAVAIGILVAGGAFYFYQRTKTIPEEESETRSIAVSKKPTPSPKPSIFLTVESPKDEEVFDQKTITISGKTDPEATIFISTAVNDQVLEPARNGNFSTTQTIQDGQNRIEITAISKNGEETTVVRTVTFSTEVF